MRVVDGSGQRNDRCVRTNSCKVTLFDVFTKSFESFKRCKKGGGSMDTIMAKIAEHIVGTRLEITSNFL